MYLLCHAVYCMLLNCRSLQLYAVFRKYAKSYPKLGLTEEEFRNLLINECEVRVMNPRRKCLSPFTCHEMMKGIELFVDILITRKISFFLWSHCLRREPFLNHHIIAAWASEKSLHSLITHFLDRSGSRETVDRACSRHSSRNMTSTTEPSRSMSLETNRLSSRWPTSSSPMQDSSGKVQWYIFKQLVDGLWKTVTFRVTLANVLLTTN